MLTTTQHSMLPTTVTGSWPRPRWFNQSLWGRRLSDAMTDIDYREKFLDAVAAVLSDQEQAGLDILTNDDYHLDESLGGQSWLLYPVERMNGVTRAETYPSSEEWSYKPGSILNEVLGGWRYPAAIDKVSRGRSWEFAKAWRIAQAKTERPVKFGTVCGQVMGSMVEVKTDKYKKDKRELDVGHEWCDQRRTAGIGGRRAAKRFRSKIRLIHMIAATKPSKEYLEFLVDAYNREVEGLDGVEVWLHTCWGIPTCNARLPIPPTRGASRFIWSGSEPTSGRWK